jgi:hypothetical protein
MDQTKSSIWAGHPERKTSLIEFFGCKRAGAQMSVVMAIEKSFVAYLCHSHAFYI